MAAPEPGARPGAPGQAPSPALARGHRAHPRRARCRDRPDRRSARLGLTGAKLACGEDECGACTILLDGEPVCACLLPAFELDGRAVITIEGLWTEAGLDPVQRAFVEACAIQCGFCTPGMILQVRSLLERDPDPDEAAIRRALKGNVCRCTGYAKILAAVRRAAGQPLAEAEV